MSSPLDIFNASSFPEALVPVGGGLFYDGRSPNGLR